jgi:hypothetical protein
MNEASDRDPGVVGPFALDHILTAELPLTLGTPDAPARYEVTAIFSRRPDPLELESLHADSVHTELAEAGYPGIALAVSDRRLLIADTNLAELEGGLAKLIGRILARIGADVAAQRAVRAGERADELGREADRAASVVAAAARVSFDPQVSAYR